MLISLLVRARSAVGVKVAVQMRSSEPATGVRSLTEPLAISMAASVKSLTLSLKVMVLVSAVEFGLGGVACEVTHAIEVADADGVGGITRDMRTGMVGDGPGAAT